MEHRINNADNASLFLSSTKDFIDTVKDNVTIENIEEISNIITPLKGICSIYKLTNSVSDQILKKRIYTFITSININKDEEVNEFLCKYYYENKEDLGQSIIEVLNSLDADIKAVVIGRLFEASIRKKISLRLLLRLTNIVKQSTIEDLKYILKHEGLDKDYNETVTDESAYYLSTLGVFRSVTTMNGYEDNLEEDFDYGAYNRTPLFYYLLEYGLKTYDFKKYYKDIWSSNKISYMQHIGVIVITIKEIKKYLKEWQHLLVPGLDIDDPNQVTYIELHMLNYIFCFLVDIVWI